MYTIELMREKDIEGLIGFFGRVYSSSHITTNPEYLSWQYRDSPYNPYSPKFSALVLKKGQNIVGFVGMIPYEFTVHGKLRSGAFLASLVVDAAYRSHGAGSLLVREAEKYFDLVYAASVNEQAIPALIYNNWSNPVLMTRFVFDFRNAPEKQVYRTNKNITKCESFGTLWDESWQKLQKSYHVTIDRSSKYLNWRYVGNPFVNYHVFIHTDTVVDGYIIARIEEGNEFRACRIVDFVANRKSSTQLLQHVLRMAQSLSLDFVDFFCWPVTYGPIFRKSGFYIYNPDEDTEPPPLILPTNRKVLTTNLLYKVVDTDAITMSEIDFFVTKGDGDRDRPNSS